MRTIGFKKVEITGKSGDGGIDGNRLIELFEEYEIGLKPKKVYEIDDEFFNDFK